jgi:hypothetical protein
LFQKPRQLETANVAAKMIRPPQKLIRTSGTSAAQNQSAQPLPEKSNNRTTDK